MIRKASWGLVLLILVLAACMGTATAPKSAGIGDPAAMEPGIVYVYKPAT